MKKKKRKISLARKFAVAIAALEGKKSQVRIADIMEIQKIQRQLIKQNPRFIAVLLADLLK